MESGFQSAFGVSGEYAGYLLLAYNILFQTYAEKEREKYDIQHDLPRRALNTMDDVKKYAKRFPESAHKAIHEIAGYLERNNDINQYDKQMVEKLIREIDTDEYKIEYHREYLKEIDHSLRSSDMRGIKGLKVYEEFWD